MKRVNNLFDKLLDIAPGGVYGLLSVIVGVGGDLIALFLYPRYDFLVHKISELGMGPGALFFNIGLILAGIIAIPFDVYLGRALRERGSDEKLIQGAVIISIICCISLSLVGVFPSNKENEVILLLHGIFSLICFLGGSIYLILFSLLMTKDDRFPKLLAYLGIIVAGLFSIFTFTWVSSTEWIANIGIVFWTVTIASYMLYKRI